MTAAAQQQAAQGDPRLFLEHVFGRDLLGGLIEVRAWEADEEGARRRFAASLNEAERAIAEFSRKRLNVCVGMSLRRSSANGTKENLATVRVLWVDVDDLADQSAREDLEIRIERFPLRPSFRIWSGGGEHLYWKLSEPLDVSTPKGIATVEKRLRALQRAFDSDPSVVDAARVMRVPGTVNYPDAKKRKKGRIDGLCVAIEGFR